MVFGQNRQKSPQNHEKICRFLRFSNIAEYQNFVHLINALYLLMLVLVLCIVFSFSEIEFFPTVSA